MKMIALIVAIAAALGGYLLYTRYFSGAPVARVALPANGVPVEVHLDPAMNPVRILSHASFQQQPSGGERRTAYLARLTLAGSTIVEREVSLGVAQAAKPGWINNTTALLDANVPAPGRYAFSLEPRGAPQFEVRNLEIEVRANAK